MSASRSVTLSRAVSRRNPLGRYTPRTFTPHSRWKFNRDRRTDKLRRVGGDPDERQAAVIQIAMDAEWSMLECKATARTLSGSQKIEALRLAAEYQRQWLLAERDLDRTIPRPKPAAAAEPLKPPPIADIIADALQRREAAG